MRLLSNEDILKNNVDTIPQFYILDYLKKNLNIGKFDVYIVDRNNLKVIDKELNKKYDCYRKNFGEGVSQSYIKAKFNNLDYIKPYFKSRKLLKTEKGNRDEK